MSEEINAQIAEKLFGLKPPFAVCHCDWPGNHVGETLIPDYSSDIAAAMLVVEHLNLSMVIDRHVPPSVPEEDRWYVNFFSETIDAEATASTLPLAICLAARKVAGGEER